MDHDLTLLVQGTDGFLEVAFADAEQTTDDLRVALVADRQGAVVLTQLGEDLGVEAGGGLLANGLQAQACLLYTSPSPRD